MPTFCVPLTVATMVAAAVSGLMANRCFDEMP